MNRLFYSSTWVLEHFRQGPLASHIDKFITILSNQRYAKGAGKLKIRLIADLNNWFEKYQFKIGDLNEKNINKYLKYRRRKGYVDRNDATTLQQFLKCLRDQEIIPAAIRVEVKESPLDRIENNYRKYLLQERGLSQATLINYLPIIRRFLSYRFGKKTILLNKIRVDDISRFILHYAKTMSRGRAKLMVTAIRSFLRHLRLIGEIETDLSASVPCVANWRLTGLPKSLSPKEVQRLLKSCNRSNPVGRRDYAILLLLARFGLRAGEIVAMTLDDINWKAGELMIRGKGLRRDLLPLPHDVGKALAAYLRTRHPGHLTRRVFICVHAPYKEITSSSTVCTIVSRALVRCDLHPDCKGAHLLRHSLANQMLQNDASLVEIGEILRHQSPHTTEIYTKVDLRALRILAQPWPIKENFYESTTQNT